MASAIVIHVCCCGEYVERIRVEIREKNIQAFRWCALQFRVDALSVRERQYSGCVDGNGASSWRLICGFMRVIEETKSPSDCGAYEGYPHSYLPHLRVTNVQSCLEEMRPLHRTKSCNHRAPSHLDWLVL